MRLIRSLFFGGLAMLAAAMFISMPARAVDHDPRLWASSLKSIDAFYSAPAFDATVPEAVEVPKRRDAHHAVYIRQNQPTTAWRFAVDA